MNSYTHRWTIHSQFSSYTKVWESIETRWRSAVADCRQLIAASGLDILVQERKRETPNSWRGGLFCIADENALLIDQSFTRPANLAREWFALDINALIDSRAPDGSTDLTQACDTGQNTYDPLIGACLIALKHNLGDEVSIESDGEWDPDWTEGVASPPDGYAPGPNYTPSPVKLYSRVSPRREIANILSEGGNNSAKHP